MTKTKTALLVVFLFVFASALSAAGRPIDKGSLNLGGAFSFMSTSGDLYGNETTTTFTFTPGGMYFIANGIAVGADIIFESTSSGGDSSTTIGIGPKAAYFFDIKSENVYPYVGIGIAYASQSYSGHSSSLNGFQFRFGGGVAVMLKPYLALIGEALYAIESMSYGSYPSESGGRFAITIGLSAFIYKQ